MVDAGAVLAVVALSGVVLLVALVVATAMVLRAIRGQVAGQNSSRAGYGVDDSTAVLAVALDQAHDVLTRLEASAYRLADLNVIGLEVAAARLADLDISGFERSVRALSDLQPGASGGPPVEVSESASSPS
jgi:hypothetical protein